MVRQLVCQRMDRAGLGEVAPKVENSYQRREHLVGAPESLQESGLVLSSLYVGYKSALMFISGLEFRYRHSEAVDCALPHEHQHSVPPGFGERLPRDPKLLPGDGTPTLTPTPSGTTRARPSDHPSRLSLAR